MMLVVWQRKPIVNKPSRPPKTYYHAFTSRQKKSMCGRVDWATEGGDTRANAPVDMQCFGCIAEIRKMKLRQ